MSEWKHDTIFTTTLFECALVLFNFGNMLMLLGYVRYSMKIGEVSLHGLKLIVG